jgi:hypothetical protein
MYAITITKAAAGEVQFSIETYAGAEGYACLESLTWEAGHLCAPDLRTFERLLDNLEADYDDNEGFSVHHNTRTAVRAFNRKLRSAVRAWKALEAARASSSL